MQCEPGKYSNYANSHYLALARIIEEVSGEPYETYTVDHILTPLGMDSTHFQLVEASERYAKGQYSATRTDSLLAQLNEFRGSSREDLILQKKIPEVLMVHPKGDGSFYCNYADGTRRFEDFIIGDLVAFMESNYRARKGRLNRSIGGTSMGGYGALKIAMKHPGLSTPQRSVIRP